MLDEKTYVKITPKCAEVLLDFWRFFRENTETGSPLYYSIDALKKAYHENKKMSNPDHGDTKYPVVGRVVIFVLGCVTGWLWALVTILVAM